MHGTSPQLWFLMLPMCILVVFNDATRRIFFFPSPPRPKLLAEALVDTWKEEQSLPSQQLAYLMDCQGTTPSDCQFLGGPSTPISHPTDLPTSARDSLCRRGGAEPGRDVPQPRSPSSWEHPQPLVQEPLVLPGSWQRS